MFVQPKMRYVLAKINRFDQTIWPAPAGKLFAALLLDAKITQKWALIPIKNACNILRLGQNFARPTLFQAPFYTPASHPFVHLLVVTVVLHAFSEKVKEIIEIANYGPAHSPTRACWITFRGLFNSCQLPENITVVLMHVWN